MFLEQSWLLPTFQPFLSSGSTGGLSVLFALGLAASISLTLGYRTRLAGLFCWYFCCMLQLRNPLVLDGGDEFLRLLLFWTPFLPLSARWSLEAKSHPEWAKLPSSYRSVATLGIFLQFALLYLFAALLKNGEDWLETGDALYYVLSLEQFSRSFGRALLGYPDLLRPLSFAALGIEFLLPLLLFIPTSVPFARGLFLILAWSLHAGIALLLDFGIFMLIMMVSLVVFLPSSWLDRFFPCQKSGDATEVTKPPAYCLRKLEKAFAAFICFYIVTVNILSLTMGARLPAWAHAVAMVTYEHQHWHLFAPNPLKEDGWFVLEATDTEGKLWYFPGSEGPEEKASHIPVQFPNQRWRRWLQNLTQSPGVDNQSWRDSTLRYFAKRWQREHPDLTAKKFRFIFMRETTPPPGEEPKPEQTILAEREIPAAGPVK